MQTLTEPEELRLACDRARARGERVALVPTMGALHAGHEALVRDAARRADTTIVSIFVNPTQFNDRRDFEGYPRTLETDLEACRAAGVDVVFAPNAAEMYPEGAATWVDVHGLTEPLCGANRPGHFRGVSTVVTKLFLAARPDVAVFGEKDYQQLLVIRRIVADLDLPVRIEGSRTLREPDGLALSSRNAYLSAEERRIAPALAATLSAVAADLAAGADGSARCARAAADLKDAGFTKVDYIEVRDAETLEPWAGPARPGRVLAAAWLGRTRLIDNLDVPNGD